MVIRLFMMTKPDKKWLRQVADLPEYSPDLRCCMLVANNAVPNTTGADGKNLNNYLVTATHRYDPSSHLH